MKAKTKQLLTLLLAGVLGLSALACGRGDGADDNQLTVLLDSGVTVVGFETDIDAGIEELSRSIEDGYTEDIPSNRMLVKNSEILRDWAKQRGVTLNAKSWGWADSLTNKLQSAFLAQDTPDLINGETQMLGFAQKGYLREFPADLSDYIRENCLSVAYSGMTVDGKIYGVCLAPGMTVLMWNKDLLRACQIDERIVEDGPKDWTEWENAMKQVYAKGKNAGGVYTGAGNVNYGAFLRSGTLMQAGGGGFADASGAPDVASAANLETFAFIRRMAGYNKPGMLNASAEDSYFSYFKTGSMAYYVDGSWGIHDAQSLDFDTGYCILPTGDGTGGGATMMIGCVYLSVPIYAKHPDLAWQLIRMFLESEIQTNVAKGGLRFSVSKSACETVYRDQQSEYYRPYFSSYLDLAHYAVDKDVKGLPSFAMDNGKLSTLWTAAGVLLAKLADNKDSTEIAVLARDAQSKMMAEWKKG